LLDLDAARTFPRSPTATARARTADDCAIDAGGNGTAVILSVVRFRPRGSGSSRPRAARHVDEAGWHPKVIASALARSE
jgi:hypothetical protein